MRKCLKKNSPEKSGEAGQKWIVEFCSSTRCYLRLSNGSVGNWTYVINRKKKIKVVWELNFLFAYKRKAVSLGCEFSASLWTEMRRVRHGKKEYVHHTGQVMSRVLWLTQEEAPCDKLSLSFVSLMPGSWFQTSLGWVVQDANGPRVNQRMRCYSHTQCLINCSITSCHLTSVEAIRLDHSFVVE